MTDLKKYWAPSQYKGSFFTYWDFCYKDEVVGRLSYLYNGDPYTGKMTSLYWQGPHVLEMTGSYLGWHSLPLGRFIVDLELNHTEIWIKCRHSTDTNVKCIFLSEDAWYWWPVDTPHKGPVMQEACPSDEVIMIYFYCVIMAHGIVVSSTMMHVSYWPAVTLWSK